MGPSMAGPGRGYKRAQRPSAQRAGVGAWLAGRGAGEGMVRRLTVTARFGRMRPLFTKTPTIRSHTAWRG